jgi:DNA invertase Pin-like site-specific DNA recombinase
MKRGRKLEVKTMKRGRKSRPVAAPSKGSRAVGYVRVSTSKQEMSPAAQEEKIRTLAKLQGSELVKVITDRESAKQGSIHTRPGMQEAMWLIDHGHADRIIVAKLDRLSRSVVDLGELLIWLNKKGASLVSVVETWMDTGSAVGMMIINIMTSVAQWERDAISERTSAVLQYKRAHGQAYGHTPYGMRAAGQSMPGKMMAGKRLVSDPAEQAIIARVRAMHNKGSTLQAIADTLNLEKVRTKGRRRAGQIQRGKWYPSRGQDTKRNLKHAKDSTATWRGRA